MSVQVQQSAARVIVGPEGPSVITVGLQGPPGTNGTNGQNGTNGTNGQNGINGRATILPAISFSFGDASPVVIHTLAEHSLITEVSVIIRNAFNGATPSIRIGTVASPELLMAANQNAPGAAAQYTTSPNADLPASTNIRLTIAPGAGATGGSGVILISLTPA